MPRLPVVTPTTIFAASDQESGKYRVSSHGALFGAHGIGRIKGRSPGHGEIIAANVELRQTESAAFGCGTRACRQCVKSPSSKAVLAVPDRHRSVAFSGPRFSKPQPPQKITIPARYAQPRPFWSFSWSITKAPRKANSTLLQVDAGASLSKTAHYRPVSQVLGRTSMLGLPVRVFPTS